MDFSSVIGLIGGIGLILMGQALEGGKVTDLLQVTAAMIVFGGTFGAVVVSFPVETLKNGVLLLKDVFFQCKVDFDEVIAEILKFAQKARKEGIIALEKEAKNASDPILKLGLEAVSDGADPTLVKEMMENQLGQLEEKINTGAKVWESAGGYAPTFGIIGAVMGLIQVMQNLSDPSKLGAGIAVAFVATIYGLFAANLVFIPSGTKIKSKYAKVFLKKEIIIEGVLAIQAGESPALIERKLQTFLLSDDKEGKEDK
ncbi:MAG: flagellar motor protein [Candidatus Gastranaerophilales bacterium]|nr:flagellar motor protein [Candidatus Gastranaerophilales bacterium]